MGTVKFRTIQTVKQPGILLNLDYFASNQHLYQIEAMVIISFEYAGPCLKQLSYLVID